MQMLQMFSTKKVTTQHRIYFSSFSRLGPGLVVSFWVLALVRYCSMLAQIQYNYDDPGPIYIHVGLALLFINSPIQKLGHRTWCQLQGPQQNPKENVSWISNINNFGCRNMWEQPTFFSFYLHDYLGYGRLNEKKNVDCSLEFSFTFYSQNCWC